MCQGERVVTDSSTIIQTSTSTEITSSARNDRPRATSSEPIVPSNVHTLSELPARARLMQFQRRQLGVMWRYFTLTRWHR